MTPPRVYQRTISCADCGSVFISKANRTKYCPECRVNRHYEPKPKTRSTRGKWIIVGYDPCRISYSIEDTLIALKGRLLTREMLLDFIDGMPAGIRIQHDTRKFKSIPGGQIIEVKEW